MLIGAALVHFSWERTPPLVAVVTACCDWSTPAQQCPLCSGRCPEKAIVDFRSLEGAVVPSCAAAGVPVKGREGPLVGCNARLSGGLGEDADQLVSNIGRERLG